MIRVIACTVRALSLNIEWLRCNAVMYDAIAWCIQKSCELDVDVF